MDSIEDAVVAEMLKQFQELSRLLANLLADLDQTPPINQAVVTRAIELARAPVLLADKFISAFEAAREFEDGNYSSN